MSKYKEQRFRQHEPKPPPKSVPVATVESIERALRGRIEELEIELAASKARIAELEGEHE